MINYQSFVDETTTPWYTYICKAELWRATSSPYWQIKWIDSNWKTEYPAKNNFPSDKFEFIADDRATLIYSFTWV